MRHAMVLAVPITLQVPTEGQRRPLTELDLGDVDGAGAVLRPEAAAVGAGAEDFSAMVTDEHGASGEDDGGEIDAGRGHDLGRKILVAAANKDDSVHRLGSDHLLGVHGEKVAEEHGGGVGEAFGDGDGGEHHGQSAGKHDTALDALDEVGDVAVARIVVAVGVGDADDGAVKRVVGEAHGLDEGFAQEERKGHVAIVCQPLVKALGHWRVPLSMDAVLGD